MGNLSCAQRQRKAAAPANACSGAVDGPITARDIQVVQETFAKAATFGAELVGTALFKNIFKTAPQALQLFSFKDEKDVYKSPKFKAHATKVVSTVGVAVGMLEKLDELVPVLQELGIKHVAYNVQEAHYDVVGEALVQTLGTMLGPYFKPEASVAWTKVFGLVKKTMVDAAKEVEAKTVVDAAKSMDPSAPMTESEVKMVKDTWASAAALGAETVGVALFKNIFDIAPGAVQLFSFRDEPDMYNSPKLKSHGKKVVSTVGVAVGMLEKLDELVPVLQELGVKHVAYDVKAAHYEVVGQALLKTLGGALGSSFKPEVELAWKKVYGLVMKTMVDAAREGAAVAK